MKAEFPISAYIFHQIDLDSGAWVINVNPFLMTGSRYTGIKLSDCNLTVLVG